MDISSLKVGDSLWLEDGSLVTVRTVSADGETVRVHYLETPFNADLNGTEATCSDYEIISFASESDIADSGAK